MSSPPPELPLRESISNGEIRDSPLRERSPTLMLTAGPPEEPVSPPRCRSCSAECLLDDWPMPGYGGFPGWSGYQPYPYYPRDRNSASIPREAPSISGCAERRPPPSPETSSSSIQYCYHQDSDESEVDSTSPDVTITSQDPGSPDEPHVTFSELISRLVRLLEIEAHHRPGPSTNRFYDIVRGEQSTTIALPLITTLFQAMVQPWDQPAQPQAMSYRYDSMYQVREEDIPFLLRHPKPNSMVVESSQGREACGHTIPHESKGRKIDMLARRVYAATGLELHTSYYEATLARYQYFIMQKLDNVASSLLDHQADLARVFIKEAMQVAIQQLSTARHHVDTDSQAMVSVFSLRLHAWLRNCNFPEKMKRRIEEMPFDGTGLFHAKTHQKLKAIHKSRMTVHRMELPQHKCKWPWPRPYGRQQYQPCQQYQQRHQRRRQQPQQCFSQGRRCFDTEKHPH
ncbi:uncharacterized protein LOC123023587 [Varanus komodoensis]|uniref:uncharacterized protein LOC123023587 n=1 Tax=Varanus komodoensis TaxID=61221 RepID=UPI001CF77178|nr:uncharacterized protein LOC123023587 [Varanus komodoensis]